MMAVVAGREIKSLEVTVDCAVLATCMFVDLSHYLVDSKSIICVTSKSHACFCEIDPCYGFHIFTFEMLLTNLGR